MLRLTLSRRALRRPLLCPFPTGGTFDAVSAGLLATGGQALAKRGARGTGRARSRELPQTLSCAPLLQPIPPFRREALPSFAALEQISAFRPLRVLPAAIPALPSITGVAVDVAVPARVDVAAAALADEALPVRRVPAQR